MAAPMILAFAGSAREGSLNKRLIRLAVAAAREAGGDVTLIDFRDLPMPMYDGDIERAEGLPPNAKRFKELMKQHQGLLIASPEYNSAISPLLKNAIDWASRSEPGDTGAVAYAGKVAAIMTASPSPFGGVRGLPVLRAILSILGVIVLPDQVMIPHADQAFDESGGLKEARHRASLERVVGRLVEVTRKLNVA